MKIRLLLALVGLAISFAVPTFAQQTKHSRSTNCASRFVACAKKKLGDVFDDGDAAAVAALLIRKRGCGDGHRNDLRSRGHRGILVELFQKMHFSKHLITVDQNSRTL